MLIEYGIIGGVILVGLLIIGLIFTRLYKRATPENALVRTGMGGRKVVTDGGCIVLPLLHEFVTVNMKTLRLEVKRNADSALITKDSMRVDVGVEFYVRVAGTNEGVGLAAQTLGKKTYETEALRDMIEGKLVDGLRAVAAKMNMDELHENRSRFVQDVQNAVDEDLRKNGLELESVSLTALDQTPFDKLDENNAFNARGMRILAEVIAESRKARANTEAEADTVVAQRQMEAAKRKFEINREQEQSEIDQQREIELSRANQKAEIAKNQASKDREAEQARIQKDQGIAISEQEKAIAIAEKSRDESKAKAEADAAKAEAVKAEQSIVTAREVAEAEREKKVAVLKAEEEAEKDATKIRVSAAAEKQAAEDRASARKTEAEAEAYAITTRAEARKAEMLAEAEGKRALVEAENSIDARIVDMKIRLAKIEALPEAVNALTKPMEGMGKNIKVNWIGGLGGEGSGGVNGANGGTLTNDVFSRMLDFRMKSPTFDRIGKDLAMSFDGDIEGILAPLADEDGDEMAKAVEAKVEERAVEKSVSEAKAADNSEADRPALTDPRGGRGNQQKPRR